MAPDNGVYLHQTLQEINSNWTPRLPGIDDKHYDYSTPYSQANGCVLADQNVADATFASVHPLEAADDT